MKRKITALGLTALLGLSLTACASTDLTPSEYTEDSSSEGLDLYEQEIFLSDGRTLVCVVYAESGGQGGLSCDWDGAE